MKKEYIIFAVAVVLVMLIVFLFNRNSVQGACQKIADNAVKEAPVQYRENTDLWYKIYVACLRVGPEKAKNLRVDIGTK